MPKAEQESREGGDLLLLLVSHRRRRRRALPPSYYTTDPTTTDCSRGTETESPALCGNGGGDGGPSAAEKVRLNSPNDASKTKEKDPEIN